MKAQKNISVRLGDVANVISGYAFKSAAFKDNGTPVIKIKNIRIGFVDISSVQYVDETYLGINEKYHVKGGDLLISLTGSHLTQPNSVVGRVALFQSSQGSGLLNQRAGKITITHPEICDKRFLFYFLNRKESTRTIALMAHGAASQANVSPSQVESIKLNLPPIITQQKIASILSTYDDLIENNTLRIRILEEMAQALYREWFIHFRVPGHEKVKMVNSPLGKIPEGWRLNKLINACIIIMGQSPKSEFYNEKGEGLPFHQGVKDFGARFPKARLYCTVMNRVAEKGDILFSVRAPVGRINLANKKIIIGRGLSAIRSVNGWQAFTFQQLKERFREEDIIGGGTIFKSVTKTDMHDIDFLMPPDSFIIKYENSVRPIFSEIENLIAKNDNLRHTRELLLPKLITSSFES